MKKVRVYEYAKEIGKQSKDIISVLKDAEIEVSNHMSMLTEEGLAKLDSVFKKVKKEQPKGNNKNKSIWRRIAVKILKEISETSELGKSLYKVTDLLNLKV